MRHGAWTYKELRLLKKDYPYCSDPMDLAKQLGRTREAVKTKAGKLKLKRLVPNGNYGRTTATTKEDQFIRENYLTMPVKVIGEKLNRGFTFVMLRIERLGLQLPRQIIEQRIAESRLKKGNVPPNKGKKWNDFMSKKGQRASRKTTFKKGTLPHNTQHDGAISIRRDTTGIQYQYIRTSLGRWELLHRLVWKHFKGKIPAKHVIIFKDGNQGNCNIENLKMITMRENMLRNSVQNYPKEISLMVQLRGALNRQINKHLKSLK